MNDDDDGDGDGEPVPDDEVIITVPADMQAGVWANWAAINESDNALRESHTSAGTVERPRSAGDRHRITAAAKGVHLLT